jgi:tetratricopeptide (TPR) repeat protein
MRGISIVLALALVAAPAWAQTQQQRDWCTSPSATDDQTIEGCTAMIQSGQGSADLAVSYYNRGIGYDGKRLYDRAIADYNQAIALNPSYASAYNNRGNAYHDEGLYDQAIADYNRAIALKSDDADVHDNRASAYEKQGLRDLAVADYRAALKLDPNRRKAKDGLMRLGVTP